MNPLETLAVTVGRHLNVRGSERVLRALYPCATTAKRFVRGVRAHGDGLRMELDSRSWIDWNLLFRGDYDAWAWGQAKVSPTEAFELLRAAGYDLFRLDGRLGTGARPLDRGTPLPDYLDLLAIHPGRVTTAA